MNIYFQGKEESEFSLTFLQTLPAYKVSWRMYLSKDNSVDNTEENKSMKNAEENNSTENSDESIENETEISIMIHGWAIIDNVLDEDWENIKLTLVSGLPVSFNYDSYSPLWISRPTIDRNSDLNTNTLDSIDQSRMNNYMSSSERDTSPKQGKKTPLELFWKYYSFGF